MTMQPRDRVVDAYRVFISYSHEDQDEFEKLNSVLRSLGLLVLSDNNIHAGTAFTDAIKGLITHAHLFIPLITKNAHGRPWVHQETGFAMARNIPILPIVLEDAGMPQEMMAQLQAIKVKADLSDLNDRLKETSLEDLILPRPGPPTEMVLIADWPEERARYFVDCAKRVRDLKQDGMLRQRGALSSFCIPDADIHDKIWKQREGKERRSDYYRTLLRAERQALEWHAQKRGCRLIVDPAIGFKYRGSKETVARLKILRDFLQEPKDYRVEIVISPEAREGSLTLVGDWFVAESLAPRLGGYRQTVFNWHAPTVTRLMRRFDQLFDDLCQEQKLDPESSIDVAIMRISEKICEYEKQTPKGKAAAARTR